MLLFHVSEYCVKFYSIYKSLGPPQRPTGLVVDCPHSAIISWRPGFDGGTTQNFIIEYSDNSSFWQTHRSESVVPIDETFMSARIKDIQPNVPYSFRIRANNIFGVAESDTTVNCTRQSKEPTHNINYLYFSRVSPLIFFISEIKFYHTFIL